MLDGNDASVCPLPFILITEMGGPNSRLTPSLLMMMRCALCQTPGLRNGSLTCNYQIPNLRCCASLWCLLAGVCLGTVIRTEPSLLSEIGVPPGGRVEDSGADYHIRAPFLTPLLRALDLVHSHPPQAVSKFSSERLPPPRSERCWWLRVDIFP